MLNIFVLCSLATVQVLAMRSSDAYTVAEDKESDCKALPELTAYQKHCGSRCKARSLSHRVSSRDLADRVRGCGQACDEAAMCNCFTVTAKGMCKLGLTASSKIKPDAGSKTSLAAAYVSTRTGLDAGSRVLFASTDDDLPNSCQRGQFAILEGDCGNYFRCEKRMWAIAHCPAGLAFNSQTRSCEWQGSVDGCEDSSSVVLEEVGCGNRTFFLVKGESAQAWIRHAMGLWTSEAAKSLGIHGRPEGLAAQKVLATVGIEISSQTTEPPSRWAVFSPGENGTLTMQAVALVAKKGGNAVDIMAIVSRRSLLKDAAAISGGGKALLAGILDSLNREGLDNVTLQGIPGDAFVEKLYRQHGMKEVGRSEDTGMPKLELPISKKCVPFMKSAILCREVGFKDYMEMAWRLLPFSEKVMETCAHIMPRDLYHKHLLKMLQFAA